MLMEAKYQATRRLRYVKKGYWTFTSCDFSPYVVSQKAFFFSGPKTSTAYDNNQVANVTIARNEILESGWTGVFASSGVDVSVSGCQFDNNKNMETGVTSSELSTVTVQRTDFTNNLGTNPNVSALVLAISDSAAIVQECSFRGNSNYTSQIFAIFRSSISIDSSCIIGTSSDTVIFASQDSDFKGVNADTQFHPRWYVDSMQWHWKQSSLLRRRGIFMF